MTKEQILSCIALENKRIEESQARIKEYLNQLGSLSDEEWDWVSVKAGADFLGVSVPMIYRKIETGLLTCKHIGSKKLVKLSELKDIDDMEQYARC